MRQILLSCHHEDLKLFLVLALEEGTCTYILANGLDVDGAWKSAKLAEFTSGSDLG